MSLKTFFANLFASPIQKELVCDNPEYRYLKAGEMVLGSDEVYSRSEWICIHHSGEANEHYRDRASKKGWVIRRKISTEAEELAKQEKENAWHVDLKRRADTLRAGQVFTEYDGVKIGDKFIWLRKEPWYKREAGAIGEVKEIYGKYFENQYPHVSVIAKIQFDTFVIEGSIYKGEVSPKHDYYSAGPNKTEICKESNREKFAQLIEGESNLKVEFVVRKKDASPTWSIWWRSTNHPEKLEWKPIYRHSEHRPGIDPPLYMRQSDPEIYEFFSEAETHETVMILEKRDPWSIGYYRKGWTTV